MFDTLDFLDDVRRSGQPAALGGCPGEMGNQRLAEELQAGNGFPVRFGILPLIPGVIFIAAVNRFDGAAPLQEGSGDLRAAQLRIGAALNARTEPHRQKPSSRWGSQFLKHAGNGPY